MDILTRSELKRSIKPDTYLQSFHNQPHNLLIIWSLLSPSYYWYTGSSSVIIVTFVRPLSSSSLTNENYISLILIRITLSLESASLVIHFASLLKISPFLFHFHISQRYHVHRLRCCCFLHPSSHAFWRKSSALVEKLRDVLQWRSQPNAQAHFVLKLRAKVAKIEITFHKLNQALDSWEFACVR